MKVIIAGGRDFDNYNLLTTTISNFEKEHGKVTEVISGTARGADILGEIYANINNIAIKKFRPDWDNLGKRAGYVRNTEMAAYAKRNDGFLIAFWNKKSKGTKHMIDYAKKVKLNTIVIHY